MAHPDEHWCRLFLRSGPGWTWLVLLHTTIGTGLIASGTAALNQWWEREADARMPRTQKRPLPSHRISPNGALCSELRFRCSVLSNFGSAPIRLLRSSAHLPSPAILFVYTPLKQVTPHSTTVGAIPGAMPPVIGYAAAHGGLTAEAWTLFAILFLWQFPHFYSIAWLYQR